MNDQFGRDIEYLRISITQKCNLKCIYCSPGEKKSGMKCSALTPEEFEKIVRSMAVLGINKVRITGGEPLTRADVCEIIQRISTIPGIRDISMTTNGIHLDKMAEKLKAAGLKRLNISLDSLQPARFQQITGGGSLDQVLAGIQKAISVGLHPVKINTVLIRGMNDDEVDDFIMFAKNHPVQVRFIELMPIGNFGEDNRDKIVLNHEIIARHSQLKPIADARENGPAKLYAGEGFIGSVGFISPMSHQFCDQCNRIRITCDGKLKPCLGDNGEIDILRILRESPDRIDDLIKKTVFEKPAGHHFNEFKSKRSMKAIGG